MRKSSPSIGFVMAIMLITSPALAGDKRKSEIKDSAEKKVLREVEQTLDVVFLMSGKNLSGNLERAIFDPEPLEEKVEKLLKKGPNPLRPHAASLLSKIKLLASKDPVGALVAVAPFLIEREAVRTWKVAFDEGRKKALADWKEKCREARKERLDLPVKPENQLFSPFPPPSEWKLTAANARSAISAGLALLEMNRRSDALSIFKIIGHKYRDGIAEIIAEEGAGDAFMSPTFYAKAAGLYQHAIKLCNHCINYLRNDESGEILHVKKRLEVKLRAARHMADRERFGPGFIAYRHCQNLRYSRQYLLAYLAYGVLKREFAGTVFSAAAEAYQIKCSLSLSEKEHEQKARAVIAKAEKEYKKADNAFKIAEKQNPLRKDRAKRKLLHTIFDKRLDALNQMRKVALGKRSAQTAQNSADLFLRDEFNLYRGGVLVDLATNAFEQQFKPAKAEQLYMKAWEWLSKVEGVDTELKAYEVPVRARKVSRPPQREAKIDRMGNIDNERISSDMIVNRQTCPYYLNDLRERCALAIGFLRFVEKDNEVALKWYEKVLELDQATNLLARKDEWNNYKRLKWGAEHGYLYAHPQELRLYKKRQRFVILMSDFYFVTGKFGKAADLYREILSGEFGRMDGRLADYPQYALAACTYWTGGLDKAYIEYLKVLKIRENTFTEDRAAYAVGHIAYRIDDKGMQDRGSALLRDLAFSGRKNEFVCRAIYSYGTRLIESGQRRNGIRVLKRMPREVNGYSELIKYYLSRSQLNSKEEKENE